MWRGKKVLEPHVEQDRPEGHGTMARKAVAPLAAMVVKNVAGALGPIDTNSTTGLAGWNRKKPGIIETTAEKAKAASGGCRRPTGANDAANRMQATNAPSRDICSSKRDQRPTRRTCEHAGGDRELALGYREEGVDGCGRPITQLAESAL
jgi:hypothetical protein